VQHKKLKLVLAIGSLIGIVLLLGLHLLLRQAVAARLPDRVCVPMYSADVVCYGQPETLSKDRPTAFAVSQLGTLLATGHGNTIQRWDLVTRQPLPPLMGHTDLITALAISPDGRLLASSSLDRTIKLWELQTGSLLGTIQSERASTLVFSPDGRTLASGSRVQHWADGAHSPIGVQFWDVASQRFLYGLGERPARAIAFSSDGQFLAAGDEKTDVWLLRGGELLYTFNSGELTGVSFSQAGQTLITGSSKIKLWDLTNGALDRTLDSGTSDLVLSPDERILAGTVGGTVRLWHLQNEQALGLLRGSWYSGLFVRFALQGQAIVAGSSEGIKIWQNVGNAKTQNIKTQVGHTAQSPDPQF
jgi:WD40 repeat protein